jgi:hypothetical protein
MSVNQHILEKLQIVPAIVPVNMATGPNNGDWVSLKYYGRCAVVFLAGAGTVGNDPILTLLQAKTVSGGSSKALNFTRADYKEATALTSSGQFTTATQAAADTFTIAGSAALQKLWVVDIKAEDLDIDGGFDCLQASIADVGTNSQIGSALYLLHEPREMSKTLPSAIID